LYRAAKALPSRHIKMENVAEARTLMLRMYRMDKQSLRGKNLCTELVEFDFGINDKCL